MKQIKRVILLLLVGLAMTAQSQSFVDSITLYNGALQPNPMRGDVLTKIELNPTQQSLALQLPSEVSNDTSRFFPPIFHQVGLSCVHAAEIGYTFTYEMNRLRGAEAGTWGSQGLNLYPYLYSFNFVNGGYGYDEGTPVYSGFEIVLSNGCPMYNDWYDPQGVSSDVYWMDGYDKYFRGMSNRIVRVKTITLNNITSFLCNLKHWLYDHAEASNIGGVAVVCVYTNHWNCNGILPPQSAHSGELVIRELGDDVGNPPPAHAMTIVGYDDNVCYDINGDGVINNSEYGALKLANSSDTWFGNGGFIWLPYSLLDEIMPIDYVRKVYVCEVEERDVQLAYKATIKHSHRGHLALHVGYSTDANSSLPQFESTYNVFNNQGGDTIHMHGIDQNPIEIGLDFSSKYSSLTSYKKYFLQAVDNNADAGNYSEGECFIRDFSLVDYRWEEAFELPCSISNIAIGKNTTTTLSINYDLLPFDGSPLPTTWNSDKVARRTVNVGSNTQIGDDVNMDMYGTDLYDCELFIKSNTTLTIGDGVTFTAKRGTCRIVVNGNLVLGENVSFRTENGATLQLEFSNAQSVSDFVGTTFQNCSLNLPNKSLSFQGCSFDETPLVMRNQSLVPGLIATVEGCSFNATANQFANAITIEQYDSYLIKDNSIDGNEMHYTNGIFVTNCGNASVIVVRRIINNSISDCYESGLVFYASSGEIRNNKITGNKVGVKLLNNSNVKDFSGICYVTDIQNTQYIHDNDNIEVNISRNCVPLRMKYNAITASSIHPYIKYEDETPANTPLNINIAHNHWGSGLNPSTHFFSTNPIVSFTYLPQWNPGSCLGNEGGDVRDMVLLADSLSDIGRFGEAKLVYKQVVSLYPSTVEAQVALKTLFNVECVSGLDFDGLKSYYLNDIVIAGNNNLNKLASSLSNRCNEALRRFDDAIAWYENVLLDTLSSFNDSIFAAIDLGELYLRMEAIGEKALVGKLAQYIPVSREAYEEQVLYALSLLPHSEKESENGYPTDYWMDIVTEQPEGYEMDEQGNVTISSAEGLAWFAAVVNGRNGQEANDFEGKTVKLVSDIDMGLHLWEAIGNSYYDDSFSYDYVQRYFKGTFVGGKHEISNLVYGERGYYRRPDQFSGYDKCQGLFGNLFNAEVKGLKLNNFICLNQDDMMMHFGSIASFSEQSVIDRCVSKGFIYEFYNGQYGDNSEIYAGGLVYNNINAAISNCVFVADSCVSYEMGGIAHSNITTMENHRAEISNCYFYGEMYDDPLIFKNRTMHTSAGIVQYNSTDPDIELGSIVRNCYYYPTEPRGDMVGYRAAVAWWHRGNSVIENCYYLAVHDTPFYTGIVSRPDEWATVDNTSAFYCANDGCILEDPVEIGGEMVDDLKEALNRWVAVQQNSTNYENWCDDVWMEQGGAPLLCAVYEATEEFTELSEVPQIYPNPAKEKVTINGIEPAEVQVYNAQGQLVKTVRGTNEIDLSGLVEGVYMVRIADVEGECWTRRVVVKK